MSKILKIPITKAPIPFFSPINNIGAHLQLYVTLYEKRIVFIVL